MAGLSITLFKSVRRSCLPHRTPIVKDCHEPISAGRRLRRLAVGGRAFAVLKATLDGVPHQVVGHFIYMSAKPHALLGFAAFTVNLQWIRQEYFGPLLEQVARIGGFEDSLSVVVLDNHGVVVAAFTPELIHGS